VVWFCGDIIFGDSFEKKTYFYFEHSLGTAVIPRTLGSR